MSSIISRAAAFKIEDIADEKTRDRVIGLTILHPTLSAFQCFSVLESTGGDVPAANDRCFHIREPGFKSEHEELLRVQRIADSYRFQVNLALSSVHRLMDSRAVRRSNHVVPIVASLEGIQSGLVAAQIADERETGKLV